MCMACMENVYGDMMVRVMQCTKEEETLVAALQGNAVEDGRDTSGDEAMHMAGDFSDFESTIAAVQHSRTERRRGALADKA